MDAASRPQSKQKQIRYGEGDKTEGRLRPSLDGLFAQSYEWFSLGSVRKEVAEIAEQAPLKAVNS